MTLTETPVQKAGAGGEAVNRIVQITVIFQ